MKLQNDNRCHFEKIKGLENRQGILREHVIDREKMINMQEKKRKSMTSPKNKIEVSTQGQCLPVENSDRLPVKMTAVVESTF